MTTLTDDQGNSYLISGGGWFQSPGLRLREYHEATEALQRIDRDQLIRAEQEIFHFHNFELHQRLERRLGPGWRSMDAMDPRLHPGITLHAATGNLSKKWALILDAIYHGDLSFTKMFSAPAAEAAPEEDNRGILRVKIRQALAAIVAQERAEAAHHEKLLGEETRTARAFIYSGAFLTGLWNAGADLAQWLKEVNDVINPVHRNLRGVHASYRALRRNSETGEDLLTAYRDEVLTAEKRELVQVLGFDPSAITREQFHQATELADLIWEDPALQVELRRFVKDYVKAQHAIEITEFSGAAAFEVLFTILLAAVTAGTGLAASAASQARHFAKFRKVGQLLMEFGEQVKKARRLRIRSAKGNQKASFEDFEILGEVEVTKPADTDPSTQRERPKHTDTEPKPTAEAGDVPNSKLLTGKVEYGSTDLSKIAIDYARTEKINGARNIAVFEYTDLDGSVKTIAKASKRGRGHAEKLIAEELKKLGIPNDNVTRIYSELAPCSAPGGFCKSMIEQGSKKSNLGPFNNAKITYSIEYGGTPHDPEKAAKGVEELRRLRELHNQGGNN